MAKHKYIESPEKMWEYFIAYRDEAKSKPRKKMVFVGKDGNKEYELLEVPLTMEGFELWCYEKEIINDLSDYFGNKNQKYTEFSDICTRIKKAIRKDQIEGGMVGQYNPSITQRLNGLVEKVQQDISVEQPLFNDVPKNNSDK